MIFTSMNQEVLGRESDYEDGASEGYIPEVVESFYKRSYYEPLDFIICGIEVRFNQPGYKLYSNLGALRVKAAKKENYDEEVAVCNRLLQG